MRTPPFSPFFAFIYNIDKCKIKWKLKESRGRKFLFSLYSREGKAFPRYNNFLKNAKILNFFNFLIKIFAFSEVKKGVKP
jgi:hypothetical protein